MTKFTMKEVAEDQGALLEKLSKQRATDETACILDLLNIVVKLSHILVDHIQEETERV